MAVPELLVAGTARGPADMSTLALSSALLAPAPVSECGVRNDSWSGRH